MESQSRSIVVKVGTETISENGQLSNTVMRNIASEIASLRSAYSTVILVSSGAVGSALGKLSPASAERMRKKKQALSAYGQLGLMQRWGTHFSVHDIECAQFLVEEHDFEEEGAENLRRTLAELRELEEEVGHRIIPVANGNDTVTHGPIDSDNDRIAARFAEVVRAELLVFLTNVDGVFTADPHTEGSKLIPEINVSTEYTLPEMRTSSTNGTGGMRSKVQQAEFLAKQGTEVVITNGKKEHAISSALSHTAGTWFHA